jgi:DNA-directed RNA polymerase specialized sigma24 family protein
MQSSITTKQLIEGMKKGERGAVEELWEQYFLQLVEFARRKWIRHGDDAECVAASAFKSLYLGAERGLFPKLSDRNNLWWLLARITSNKIADRIQHANAQKRGGGRVVSLAAANVDPADVDAPSPSFLAELNDTYQQSIDRLDDDVLREVARLKLELYSIDEIAERLDCSRATVDRKLRIIRSTLKEAISK